MIEQRSSRSLKILLERSSCVLQDPSASDPQEGASWQLVDMKRLVLARALFLGCTV